jgi:hypothetical protein
MRPPPDVTSVCSLGIAKKMTVCLGEEFHSYSNFFLILFHHRSQEVHEFVNLGRVFLAGEVAAEAPNKIDVVHERPPRPEGLFLYRALG